MNSALISEAKKQFVVSLNLNASFFVSRFKVTIFFRYLKVHKQRLCFLEDKQLNLQKRGLPNFLNPIYTNK